LTPKEFEDAKVESAIRTDFILSAEIMAISLATVSDSPLWLQAIALAVVGVGMTALVYGAVAIIVRADDWGAALALTPNGASQALGRAIVRGMPRFLTALSHIGMAAMLWVGGGILIHGAHTLGWHAPEEMQHAIAHALTPAIAVLGGVIEWLVNASVAALVGLGVGAACAVAEKRLLSPTLERFQAARAKQA
jgi:predicted DNA repair protein MutK